MEKLELYIPKPEDLWFYQKMMSDPATMAYNAGWDMDFDGYHKDTGCIDCPDEELPDWYDYWIGQEPERFYAYIKRSSDGAWIGDVNFHCREPNSFQCIQNGNGCMGVGGGIDDDTVKFAVGLLNFIHQAAFVIGLVLLDFQTLRCCGSVQQGQQVGIGIGTVDSRFPDPQHIDIGAVEYKNFHGLTSCSIRACRAADSGSVLLWMSQSINR